MKNFLSCVFALKARHQVSSLSFIRLC